MLDQVLNALTILSWVLLVLYLLLSSLRGFQAGGVGGAIGSITRWRVLIALLLVIGISLLSASLVFVQPQEVAVVVSLVSRDGYREDPLRSGLHWIAPLAEKTEIYPIYWQTYTMSSEALEGEKIGDDSIAARTSDGQAVYVDVSVIYRIDSNDVIRIHIDLQDRYVDDYIRPVLRGIVRTEVSQFTADEVNSSKRKNLEAILDEKMREALGEKGFVLDRFLLRNIGFSTAYAAAIEQKQVAEQEKQQREFQAEQIRKLAEGQRDKYKLEAEGQAAAIVLEGQASADVILLKAQAEAEALRLIKIALDGDQNLITYRYVDKLGPGVQVMLVPADNPYLLPLPDLTANLDIGNGTIPTTTLETDILDSITATEVLTPTIESPTLTP
ncbi:MAG: prohibitin family protein [Anaerolineales bacterium]|nr:prohibitin family protein [Anaerolineales bacterium]